MITITIPILTSHGNEYISIIYSLGYCCLVLKMSSQKVVEVTGILKRHLTI